VGICVKKQKGGRWLYEGKGSIFPELNGVVTKGEHLGNYNLQLPRPELTDIESSAKADRAEDSVSLCCGGIGKDRLEKEILN
jgi:hypothetical protein